MRRLRVEYTLAARYDLRDTLVFLMRIGASRTTASAYVDRLRARCRKLGDVPHVGAAREEWLNGLRTVGFERSATIAFRVLADRVQIVNVFYGRQDVQGFYQRRRAEPSG